MPAQQALMNAARLPAIIPRRPSRAISLLRSGAMPPMPPTWIAMLEKLANPTTAYDVIRALRGRLAGRAERRAAKRVIP